VMTTPSILLMDDNPDDRALAIRALRQDDPALRVAEIASTTVLGYLYGERDHRRLEVIVRQAAALRRPVEDLSDVARISTEVLSLEWQAVDLDALTLPLQWPTRPAARVGCTLSPHFRCKKTTIRSHPRHIAAI
jgi:hypothetical protein